ncbi:hypothetical protein KIH41_16960 [Litoribacter ruber]|uniref:hypothetical protein n=1 Tax=Litoribacter ruber TaxID=702568 RepID=UPI001BD9A1F8|nr:hypothetical protein [Litoribacter ruber]MBT0812980.1 hypothetical protein [Litoribacter ruber]
MLDIALVKLELEEKQVQISAKQDRILSQNLDPFLFDRLEKARTLLKLIKEAQIAFQEDVLFRVGNLVKTMEEEGLNFRVPLV